MRASAATLTVGIVIAGIDSTARADPCTQHEVLKLTALTPTHYGRFGETISISDERLIIGANGNDDACPENPNCNSGAAFVFRLDDNGTVFNPDDDTWALEDKLTASDADEGDLFGDSVSISGGWAVIGAAFDDELGSRSGSAYLFHRTDNDTPTDPSDDAWIEAAKLTAPDAADSDFFGISVAISGTWVVIGAFQNDEVAFNSGSAYFYQREDNGTPTDPTDDDWILASNVTGSDTGAGDFFGYSVAIDGDRAVIGASGDDDGGIESGAAYVFQRDDNGTPLDPSDDAWIEQEKITASDAAGHDRFGRSVSVHGDHIIIAARGEHAERCSDTFEPCISDEDCMVGSCSVSGNPCHSMYECMGGTCCFGDTPSGGCHSEFDCFLEGPCDCPPPQEACLGGAVCGVQSGSAYVYGFNGANWIQEAKLSAADGEPGDFFGVSVSIHGERAIVGAHLDDDTGSAYVFQEDDNGTPTDPSDDLWVQQLAKLTASDGAAGDLLGSSVALTGAWAIVGAGSDEIEGVSGGSVSVFSLQQICVIPAVSEWGLVMMGLLILLLGVIFVVRKGTTSSTMEATPRRNTP